MLFKSYQVCNKENKIITLFKSLFTGNSWVKNRIEIIILLILNIHTLALFRSIQALLWIILWLSKENINNNNNNKNELGKPYVFIISSLKRFIVCLRVLLNDLLFFFILHLFKRKRYFFLFIFIKYYNVRSQFFLFQKWSTFFNILCQFCFVNTFFFAILYDDT